VDTDAVFPPPPFLPHLTDGYFRRPERPKRLREKLRDLRHVALGTGVAEEVLECDVPVGKTRFLEPWNVVERVPLGERPL
jgi:hypothetical protein